MNTRSVLGSILGSVAVLVIGWQAGSAAQEAPAATASGSTGSTSTGSSSTGTTSGTSTDTTGSTTSGASTDSGSGSSGSAADGTVAGDVVDTRFGTVQVSITVSGGAITDVTALKLTDSDGRSVSISNRAAPILASEVIAAQSAQVNMVSGATYTSDAYLTSVQSAIDRAGL